MSKKRRLSSSTYNKTYENKDKGGVSRKTIMDWKKCSGDRDLKFFEPREGGNRINIIPFEVKTKNHPLVKSGELEIGDLDFMLDIWVHRYIGPNGADVVCLKRNYGKHCPVCEQAHEYYEEGKKKEYENLRPTRRVLLNVQALVQGEWQPLQVWEVSHYLFMKELIEEAHACKEGEDILPFADIDRGRIVKFRMIWEELGKNKTPKFKSFDFVKREEELDEDIIDQAVSFDEGLIILSPEEIESILYGQDEDKGKESPKDEETQEEEKPSKKEEKKSSSKDDEEEEEKPAKKSDSKCPNGHKWGEADDHKECTKCAVWDDCVEAGK